METEKTDPIHTVARHTKDSLRSGVRPRRAFENGVELNPKQKRRREISQCRDSVFQTTMDKFSPENLRPSIQSDDPVPELIRLLGKPVVFLGWPKGLKGDRRKWGHLTAANMTADYLAKLRHGNIGVALGEKSGGLCAIDCDDEDFLKSFAAANPQLDGTLQTHGARGRVYWMRFAGKYPTKSIKLKTKGGAEVGEYRANGNQSIIWGVHPGTGKEYQFVVKKPVLTVDFASIVWPDSLAKNPVNREWTEVTEVPEVTNVAEVADEADVIVCGGSVFSLIESVEDAVKKCLPETVNTNNARLFDLARACLTLTEVDPIL